MIKVCGYFVVYMSDVSYSELRLRLEYVNVFSSYATTTAI